MLYYRRINGKEPAFGGENRMSIISKPWKAVKKWLFPGWVWVMLMVCAGTLSLFMVFTRDLRGKPFSYGAYCLSFYALVIAVIKAITVGKTVRQKLHEISITHRYLTDDYFKVYLGLIVSLLVNLCYAGLRMGYAVWYSSFWDGALMVYYILLCAVRFYLIRRVPAAREIVDYRRELSHYRTTGIFLMVLNLALMCIAAQIVRDGRGYYYPGTLIYAVAFHAFYSLTLSIVNVVKYRHLKSPVLSAAKAVNLMTAVVSIFSLETAMLAEFGGEAKFQIHMTSVTACAVCCFAFAQSVFMLTYANRKYKQLPDSPH